MTKVTMPKPVAWATPDLSKLFGENEMRTLEGLGGSREKQKTVFSVALITTTQAEAYADARVREALEEAALSIEALRDSHCADTAKAADEDACTPDGMNCDIVGAWNDAIGIIRALLPPTE